MINIQKKNGKTIIIYKENGKIRYKYEPIQSFKIKKSSNGQYTDLKTGEKYKPVQNGGEYGYNCINNNKNYNMFLTCSFKWSDEFLTKLETPNYIFYDLETNEHAVTENNNNQLYPTRKSKTVINSIAWINNENGEEYCLVRGVDGSEKEILTEFHKYLHQHQIMGLIGFNNYGFDDQILKARLSRYGINNSICSSTCNLDVMKIANTLNYTNESLISLNNLASLLSLNESKTETGIYNPITLYNEGLKDENKLKLFQTYNIQDVRLTKKIYEHMDSMKTLKELFIQTRCPFNKITNGPSYLLNSYICNKAYKENIVIPTKSTIKSNISFKGGHNYCKPSEELQIYKNIAVYDVVSFYPNLMRIIQADPYYEYSNIDKNTGEIDSFTNLPTHGYIGEIATELFKSRIETKKLMKNTTNPLEKQVLDKKQLTKKILVNALFGAISKDFFVLQNSFLSQVITSMGRDILEHVIEKFGAVYGKTDSVFIPVKSDEEAIALEDEINTYISNYLNSRYNLHNNGIIMMEYDDYLNQFIINDKNDYVKVKGTSINYKGPNYINKKYSGFENDIVNKTTRLLIKGESTKKIFEDMLIFIDNKYRNNKFIQYYGKPHKLSSKTLNNRIELGRKYMDDNNIPYTLDFTYNYVQVNEPDYDYIMYPNGHNITDYTVSKEFIYNISLNLLLNLKIINETTYNTYFKHYCNTNEKIIDINQSKLTDSIKKNLSNNDVSLSNVEDVNASTNIGSADIIEGEEETAMHRRNIDSSQEVQRNDENKVNVYNEPYNYEKLYKELEPETHKFKENYDLVSIDDINQLNNTVDDGLIPEQKREIIIGSECELSVTQKAQSTFEYHLYYQGENLFHFHTDKYPDEINNTSQFFKDMRKKIDDLEMYNVKRIEKELLATLLGLKDDMKAYISNTATNNVEKENKLLNNIKLKCENNSEILLTKLEEYNISLMEYLYYCINWLNSGEADNTLTGMLCHLSTYLGKFPLWFVVSGKASAGKSVIDSSAQIMMPPETFLDGRISEAALHRKTLDHGNDYLDEHVMLMKDMGGASDIEKWKDTINRYKELTTDGKCTVEKTSQTKNKKTGELDTVIFEIIGRCSVSMTTVDAEEFDEQIQSRGINAMPKATDEQVAEFEKYNNVIVKDKREHVIKQDIGLLHDYIRNIKYKYRDIEVFNPYHDCLVEWFKGSASFKRNLDKFNNLVETVTLLNYHARPKIVNKYTGAEYLVASRSDNELMSKLVIPVSGLSINAINLFNKLINWYGNKLDYSDYEIKAKEDYKNYMDEAYNFDETTYIFNVSNVRNHIPKGNTNFNRNNISSILMNLLKYGLINKIGKMRGKDNENVYMLTQVDKLNSQGIKFSKSIFEKYINQVCGAWGVSRECILEKISEEKTETFYLSSKSDLTLPPWVVDKECN